MCGLCAPAAGHWSGPLVSGPRRRQGIAKLYTQLCQGIVVSTFPQGWLVTRATGAGATASNLGQLATLLTGMLREGSWQTIEQQLPVGCATLDEPYAEHIPLQRAALGPAPIPGSPVLVNSIGAPTHLRLAAFMLGISAFDKTEVYLDFVSRVAQFRLFASNGEVRAALPL